MYDCAVHRLRRCLLFLVINRQGRDTREKISQYGMKLECWFPLGGAGRGNETLFNDPVITEIAAAHAKSPAQVILRWHMQSGNITMPGSIIDWQIKENININDFMLTDEEMARINALDGRGRFFTPMPREQLEQFIVNWPLGD